MCLGACHPMARHYANLESLFKPLAKKCRHILYVPGNYDYYKSLPINPDDAAQPAVFGDDPPQPLPVPATDGRWLLVDVTDRSKPPEQAPDSRPTRGQRAPVPLPPDRR